MRAIQFIMTLAAGSVKPGFAWGDLLDGQPGCTGPHLANVKVDPEISLFHFGAGGRMIEIHAGALA